MIQNKSKDNNRKLKHKSRTRNHPTPVISKTTKSKEKSEERPKSLVSKMSRAEYQISKVPPPKEGFFINLDRDDAIVKAQPHKWLEMQDKQNFESSKGGINIHKDPETIKRIKVLQEDYSESKVKCNSLQEHSMN